MKTIHAVLGAALLGLFGPVYPQASSANQAAADAVRKMQRYQDEASALDPQDIYRELERVRAVIAIKSQNSALPDPTDEDTLKGSGYAAALQARRKQGEPAAAHYWGLYNSRICSALDLGKNIGDTAKNCWADTLESFRIASEHGMARSSFNIGLMYENGWGVVQSKFVAADWFIRAAEKYKQDGLREGALESVEAALRVVPDLPAAQLMKAQLFKWQRGT